MTEGLQTFKGRAERDIVWIGLKRLSWEKRQTGSYKHDDVLSGQTAQNYPAFQGKLTLLSEHR